MVSPNSAHWPSCKRGIGWIDNASGTSRDCFRGLARRNCFKRVEHCCNVDMFLFSNFALQDLRGNMNLGRTAHLVRLIGDPPSSMAQAFCMVVHRPSAGSLFEPLPEMSGNPAKASSNAIGFLPVFGPVQASVSRACPLVGIDHSNSNRHEPGTSKRAVVMQYRGSCRCY